MLSKRYASIGNGRKVHGKQRYIKHNKVKYHMRASGSLSRFGHNLAVGEIRRKEGGKDELE